MRAHRRPPPAFMALAAHVSGILGGAVARAGTRRRLFTVLAVYLALTGGMVYRLIDVQVVRAEVYEEQAVRRTHREVALPASRGRLYDREGRPLALSVTAATVEADPFVVAREKVDVDEAALRIAEVLDTDVAEVRAALSGDGRFAYVARQVPATVGEEIAALNIPGVLVRPEPTRVYPAGDLAAPVVGFAGLDHEGLSGVESAYEQVLAGRPGMSREERAPRGLTISAAPQQIEPAVAGRDLVLTLDREIQAATEEALTEVVEAERAAGAAAVVLDPSTGELLALASVDSDTEPRATRAAAVTDMYEPGSVNKVITIAAALEDGVVSPSTVIDVPSAYQVADKEFTDVHADADGVATVSEVLAASSNIGTIRIAELLGVERLHHWAEAFGYGSSTGLGFPGETAGLLPDPASWSGTTLPTVAIGQGVSASLLQVAGALGVIASGGEAVEPRLVRGSVGADGELVSAPPAERRRVVSASTARAVAQMLVGVVEGEAGTGAAAVVPGYHVAGKTGTSLKPSRTERGYEPGAYVASFAGFGPVAAPELVVAVSIDEPQEHIYGGQVAAPVFSEIMAFALAHQRVPTSLDAPRAPVAPEDAQVVESLP